MTIDIAEVKARKVKREDEHMRTFPRNANSGYEANLRKRIKAFPSTATADELLYLLEQNSRINGTKLNEKNLERYKAIKSALVSFAKASNDVLKLEEEPPMQTRMFANLHLYVDDPFGRNIKSLKPIMGAIALADEFTISTEGEFIQLSFTVYDIWEE